MSSNDAACLLGLAVHLDHVEAIDLPKHRGLGRQRCAAADHKLQPVEAEFVENRPENQRLQDAIEGFLQASCRAIPPAAGVPARKPHRKLVSRALDAAGVEHADQRMRCEFLQIARDGEHHGRRDLKQRRREVLGVLAEMRHQLRHQRQRDGDVAAEHVAHRQIDDCAMRLLAQCRIMRDDGVGGGKVLAMADQRTLRMTGRARSIDDESRVGRRKSCQFLFEPREVRLFRRGQQIGEAVQLLVRVAEHRGIVEHDDRAQVRQPACYRQDLVDIFLVFGDENAGAAVPHLVFDLSWRGCRIDAVGDGAERLRGEIADHPLFADITHDGDALAARNAEALQRARGVRDQRRIVAPAALAKDTEMLGAEGDRIRHCSRPLAQEMQSGRMAQPVAIDRHGHRALFPRLA